MNNKPKQSVVKPSKAKSKPKMLRRKDQIKAEKDSSKIKIPSVIKKSSSIPKNKTKKFKSIIEGSLRRSTTIKHDVNKGYNYGFQTLQSLNNMLIEVTK
jgi:hypothetical protein